VHTEALKYLQTSMKSVLIVLLGSKESKLKQASSPSARHALPAKHLAHAMLHTAVTALAILSLMAQV
jgi:hypothetical protein